MKTTIGIVLIVKNEELMLENALKTLKWCDEIVVVDNGSTDKTIKIAKKYTDKVFLSSEKSFAKLRDFAASKIKSDYIFYLDADERVTPKLKKEILENINKNLYASLRLKRKNMLYGKYFKFGNWQNDWTLRIFFKKNLSNWYGKIHETPLIKGKIIDLKEQLIHFTHKNTRENTFKSAAWTPMEAELLAKKIKKVGAWTILRKGIMEFFRRYFLYKGYKDGMEGFVESLVQAINKFFVYIQVWEFQQSPSLFEKYKKEDEKIVRLWKESKE